MSHKELEECITTCGTDLFSFCCQLTRNRQEAEDLYQDTFLKAIELAERLDPDRNVKSALLSIAVNLWRNRRRKMAIRLRITGPQISVEDMETQIPERGAAVEDACIDREERRIVREAVAALPERYRLPVLLRYMEELKVSEISQVLGVPEGTVKSRLYKAKRLLEKELEVVLNEAWDG